MDNNKQHHLLTIIFTVFCFIVLSIMLVSWWISREVGKSDESPSTKSFSVENIESAGPPKRGEILIPEKFDKDVSSQNSSSVQSSPSLDAEKKIIYEIPLDDNILIQ